MTDLKMSVDAIANKEDTHITKDQLQASLTEINRIQADHEARTRILEKISVQLMTWGSVAMIVLGILSVVINHIWK